MKEPRTAAERIPRGPAARGAAAAILLLLLAATALTGCQEQRIDGNTTDVIRPGTTPSVRPDIPRTEPTETGQPTLPGTARPTPEEYGFLDSSIFIRSPAGGKAGIVVGDPVHPFLYGEKLGELLPLLTRRQLPLLAMEQPRLDAVTIRAEPFIRFDFDEETSGELRFVRDPDTEQVSSELFFEEGKPIIEYAYLLHDAAFPVLEGTRIDFFGHWYEIEEAYNRSVRLRGLDGAPTVILSNGSRLSVDGKSYGDTEVTVDPWHVTIRYLAPDIDEGGIRLLPGEGLRSKLRDPAMLLNPVFDIVYDGREESQGAAFGLKVHGDEVRLDATRRDGEGFSMDLIAAEGGNLTWGDTNHPLHVTRCARPSWCIALGERFLLNVAGTTMLFEFSSVDAWGKDVTLEELALDEQHTVKLRDTGRKSGNRSILEGMLLFGPETVRVELLAGGGENDTLFIEMRGDGSGNLPILLPGMNELRFGERPGELEFFSPRQGELEEERIGINVTLDDRDGTDDGLLLATDLPLARIDDEDEHVGMTPRGIAVVLKGSPDGDRGDELLLSYPFDYAAGIVRIVG